MSVLSDLIRTGNRFQKMLDDGQKAKAIARDAGITPGAFWKAVYAARDDRAPIVEVISFHKRRYGTAPPSANPETAFVLSPADVRMLHAIRDEIRAADAMAIQAEVERRGQD